MRKYINKYLLQYFEKFDPAFLRSRHPYYTEMSHGDFFNDLHDKGLVVTNTPVSIWRRDRFFNLISALDLVKDIDGEVAELGVWKGFSSYLICHRLKMFDTLFEGDKYHIFDSFEGLSAPSEKDGLPKEFEGMFNVSMSETVKALNEFPKITYHKGWIPFIFKDLPEKRYRFVHVDVDLVDPTIASFKYFYPRLVDGGIMVCDDYASNVWPGTKKIVDEFCEEYNARALRLSTSQIIIFK